MKIHSTTEAGFSLGQTIEKAHGLGCHHIATSKNGLAAASAGFGGELKTWTLNEGQWVANGDIVGAISLTQYQIQHACHPFLNRSQTVAKRARLGP